MTWHEDEPDDVQEMEDNVVVVLIVVVAVV